MCNLILQSMTVLQSQLVQPPAHVMSVYVFKDTWSAPHGSEHCKTLQELPSSLFLHYQFTEGNKLYISETPFISLLVAHGL